MLSGVIPTNPAVSAPVVDTPATTVMTTAPLPVSGNITSESLSRALNKAMADIPSGRKGSLEANVTLQGAEVEVGQRFGQNWLAGAYASYGWDGNKTAGVRFRGAW
jgi:hypothetical protein